MQKTPFDQIKQSVLIRNSPESRYRVSLFHNKWSYIKAIYKPPTNIIFNGEKLKSFPRSEIGQVFLLTIFVQHSFKNTSHSNYRGKRNSNQKRISKTISVCQIHSTIHVIFV